MYQLTLGMMAALPLVHGIAFPAPSPTIANPVDKALIEWTPQTTPKPRHRAVIDLEKRQTDYFSRDPGLCGWVDSGVSSLACPGTGLTCALYTSGTGGMAGCCDSSDTQNCNWANSCVNYDAWTKKSCDAACQSNTFVRKCTSAASPYCVTWTYPSDGVADYGCADYNSGVVTVEQSSTDILLESAYWITLPTLSGDAVTGWDGEASSLFSTSDPEPTDAASGNNNNNHNSNSNSNTTPNHQTPTPKKKTSVGLIAGAAVGGLVVLFLLGAALLFFCVKHRKAKQLANNQNIIAAQQAQNHAQPPPPAQSYQEYKPPVQMPPPAQSPPQPQQPGYFAPQVQAHDQKVTYQTHVQEQGPQSPMVSNPPTPAPPYVQPYYAAPNAGAGVPPVPEGRYEVDGITAVQGQGQVQRPGAIEIGTGK